MLANVSLQNLESFLCWMWGDRQYALCMWILADGQVNLCVSAVRAPSEKQNGQPGGVMVESGDAGRQFNDSPHPWTYKPVSAWHARRCTHDVWHMHLYVWYMVWRFLKKTPGLVKMKEKEIFLCMTLENITGGARNGFQALLLSVNVYCWK